MPKRRGLYIYGCLSNESFDDPDIMEKIKKTLILTSDTYRNKVRPFKAVLPDHVRSKRSDGKKCLYISPDRFETDKNWLSVIYRLKAGSDKKYGTEIVFLDKLNTSNKNNSVKERLEYLNEIKEYYGKDCTGDSLFFLRTDEEQSGGQLTENELRQLYTALKFFSCRAPYSVPGVFACDRINDYFRLTGKEQAGDNTFIFSYNSLDRILNDNAVCCIFSAISENKAIAFNDRRVEQQERRRSQKSKDDPDKKLNKTFISNKAEVLPLKVIYEYQSGRGYLLAWSIKKEDLRVIRLDDIFNAKICPCPLDREKMDAVMNKLDSVSGNILYSYKRDAGSHIEIDFDVPASEIKRAFGIGTVTPVTSESCRFEADINNCSDIVPLVLRYGSRAHISKERSPELYGIIKQRTEEAMRDYGLIQ